VDPVGLHPPVSEFKEIKKDVGSDAIADKTKCVH
jgi:hypothetical protein